MINRRYFLRSTAMSGAAWLGCAGPPANAGPGTGVRIRARPRTPDRHLPRGVHELPDSIGSHAALYVPSAYAAGEPVPLFVMLHGAGASRDQMDLFFPHAETFGMLALTPKSIGRTWDLVLGAFGPDVGVLDRALEFVFSNASVDPSSITLGGFSDGGSYALSLGLANGDLFSRLVGFSPGFLAPPQRIGRPAIFITHGTRDTILPIDATSRVIDRRLRAWQYDVTYREFDGLHTMRLDLVLEAFGWMKRNR